MLLGLSYDPYGWQVFESRACIRGLAVEMAAWETSCALTHRLWSATVDCPRLLLAASAVRPLDPSPCLAVTAHRQVY